MKQVKEHSSYQCNEPSSTKKKKKKELSLAHNKEKISYIHTYIYSPDGFRDRSSGVSITSKTVHEAFAY